MRAYNIERFYDASDHDYSRALAEVASGRKRSHWMWYIFPQLADLGFSATAKYYGITCADEARAFYEDSVLGPRLREISAALLDLPATDAREIFGNIDALKLCSCMTLFGAVAPECGVFQQVLDKYFDGIPDNLTLELLGAQTSDPSDASHGQQSPSATPSEQCSPAAISHEPRTPSGASCEQCFPTAASCEQCAPLVISSERSESRNLSPAEKRAQLRASIEAFVPFNEQETADKQVILHALDTVPNVFDRTAQAHMACSIWVVDPTRTQTLMVYHNIYDSWSWIGGHADGEADLAAVALRELEEETGVSQAKLLLDGAVYAVEVLTVDGHEKRGEYVSSHLHLNVTYLAEADPTQPLRIKPDENSGVRWVSLEQAIELSTEPWIRDRIYRKLIAKLEG